MKRLLLLAAVLLAFTMPASAEFKLDSRYQDADGDLIADTPTDATQQVDPVNPDLCLHPGRRSGCLRRGMGRLPQAHGRKDRQEGAILPRTVERRPDRGDACRPPSHCRFQHRVQSARGGLRRVQPFHDDGVRATVPSATKWRSSPIRIRASRKSRTSRARSWPSHQKLQTRVSRHHRPSLRPTMDMVAGTDFEPVFSGKHDNSILGVANKDYPAAAVANSVLKRMLAARCGQGRTTRSRSTSRKHSRRPAMASSTT